MKKKSRRRAGTRKPERRLEELQRAVPYPMTDRLDLRQPYQSSSGAKEYTVETFTTYGAYQDPV
jgi:hypothetical protein